MKEIYNSSKSKNGVLCRIMQQQTSRGKRYYETMPEENKDKWRGSNDKTVSPHQKVYFRCGLCVLDTFRPPINPNINLLQIFRGMEQ